VFARDHAQAHGIKLGSVEVDLAALMKAQGRRRRQTGRRRGQLAKARKITVVTGTASFANDRSHRSRARATPPSARSRRKHRHRHGLRPGRTAVPEVRRQDRRLQRHAIALPPCRSRLVVVGGGAIGLELGSVWSRLGAR
jgi:dihydrolipoamide dehydrogenase